MQIRRHVSRSAAETTKWFKNFGFALLVLVALGVAAGLGLNCAVPNPVPDSP